MSRRDQEIIRQRGLGKKVDDLDSLTRQIKVAKQGQRRLIRDLRKAGLSSRFLGKLSDMSPQTILNIAKAKASR